MDIRIPDDIFTRVVFALIPSNEKSPINPIRDMAVRLCVSQVVWGINIFTHRTRIVAIEKTLNVRMDMIVAYDADLPKVFSKKSDSDVFVLNSLNAVSYVLELPKKRADAAPKARGQ